MVSLTERVIHLEKQTAVAARNDQTTADLVYPSQSLNEGRPLSGEAVADEGHNAGIRIRQTSLTQVRAQVVQLERLSLNEGRFRSGEAASASELQRRVDKQFAQLDVQMTELGQRFQFLVVMETGQCNLSDSFRPDPTSNSFRKPRTDMEIVRGCPLFVAHAVLETPNYVKDDKS